MMTDWYAMFIEDIAKKYSCKAVIDYDQHNITIDGDPELAVMAFSEIGATLKIELKDRRFEK